MKKITCVYTGLGGLVDVIEKSFKETCGDIKFHHIADSGLISDIVEAGGITSKLEERLYALFDAAVTTEPDIIVSTCSSIGEITRKYASDHPETKMLSIDYPMAKYAAENGKKVGILATLSTTVAPSAHLVKELAEKAGRNVEVVEAVAEGAFEAMRNGNMKEATDIVIKKAKELCSDADIILLAQASMSNFKSALREQIGNEVKLLESPLSCAAYLRENI